MFCPKCGSLLVPKEHKGKKVVACSCGYSEKSDGNAHIKEAVKSKAHLVDVVGDHSEKQLPVSDDEICPKCHKKGAQYWFVQTRAGDEPETRFLKCIHCKHTWREYA